MMPKTLNIEETVYNDFSRFCKSHGINMTKQVESFMKYMMEENPEAKGEYLQKLDKIMRTKT